MAKKIFSLEYKPNEFGRIQHSIIAKSAGKAKRKMLAWLKEEVNFIATIDEVKILGTLSLGSHKND